MITNDTSDIISKLQYCLELMQNDQFPYSSQYDWINKQFLGKGGFGEVFKVLQKKTKKPVAIKKIDMSKFDEPFKMEALKNQLIAMKQLESPHTLSMNKYSLGKAYTYIVLDLCDSDLKQILLENGQKIPEDRAIDILRQIVEAFKILVHRGYIHRDVKPENILSKNNQYKLADFGFVKKVNHIDFEKLQQICGTPFYMAPQLLYKKQYTSKCDIWSLGLVFYQMLFGYSPWCNRQINVYKQSVVSKPIAFPYKCQISQYTKDFLEKCLQLQESDRISWKQIFQHPLIAKGNKGRPIKFMDLPVDIIKILIRAQQSSSRKCINSLQLFKKYAKYSKIDHKLFDQLMRQLDPQITTFQSQRIFKTMDFTKDAIIDLAEFKAFFISVDYRPANDIASRRIQQIVKMAQNRQINIKDFFNLFDKNKSSEIDMQEFYSFIKYIAPQIPNVQIQLMWKRFDADNSGFITMQEFIDQVTRGVPEMQSNLQIENYEQAKRNIVCLRSFLNKNNVTAEMFFGKAKLDSKSWMKLQDFAPLIKKINYVISQQQIRDMFRMIDKNNSGTIEIHEIRQLLLS